MLILGMMIRNEASTSGQQNQPTLESKPGCRVIWVTGFVLVARKDRHRREPKEGETIRKSKGGSTEICVHNALRHAREGGHPGFSSGFPPKARGNDVVGLLWTVYSAALYCCTKEYTRLLQNPKRPSPSRKRGSRNVFTDWIPAKSTRE
jgi:hypothetical protein